MRPTQGEQRVSQGLEGVRRAAKERKQEKFTALLHHLTIDVLRESFYNIKRSAAAGVDQVTWKEYAEGVEDRLRDLHDRVHRGAYRAQPSRRVYILKSDGRQRPLMEDGEWKETEVGTPQGSSISPLLANVYLHYALDLWVMAWRRQAVGDVIMVRYADDAVLGFENREEAERLRRELQEQLRRVGLELHPEKTRMIEFGRFAESNRKRRGEGKPETFDFLGFTHMCGRTRTAGRFTVKRKTIGKRMRAKLQEIRQQLRQRMHDAVPETGKWLRSVVQGYFNYHAVPGNGDRMQAFRDAVTRYWWWTLSRRSQKGRIDWERMRRLVRRWIPSVRIMHPYPSVRFDAIHPR
jgi:hypothetical protein